MKQQRGVAWKGWQEWIISWRRGFLADTMAVRAGGWAPGGNAGSLDDHRLGARIGPAL